MMHRYRYLLLRGGFSMSEFKNDKEIRIKQLVKLFEGILKIINATDSQIILIICESVAINV